MPRIKFLTCIFLFLFVFLQFQEAKAQEREILEGRVVLDSSQDLSGIHVVNLNAESGTTTNADGIFKTLAQPGDTLFFSALQFEHKKVVVSKIDLEKGISVKMIEKYNELDEIRLDNIKLSGVLSQDLDKVPKSIYEKLGMPFPKPRRTSLELAIQSANGGGPLVSLLNTLNGKKEQLEKAKKNYSQRDLVYTARDMLGESIFISELGIPQKEIINFLFYCSYDSEFSHLVNSEKLLELVEFYKSQVESFKELRELD